MANLTGKQIADLGIVTRIENPECIQQHSVDLELIKVEQITGSGFIPKVGKTSLAVRIEVLPTPFQSEQETSAWFLSPGVYDITFKQGCQIPNNQRLEIVQRSSLLRNGALLKSSLFDAGFCTENIGTVIHIQQPLVIEVGARIATAYTTESNVVENLYNGQWQNDVQREQK